MLYDFFRLILKANRHILEVLQFKHDLVKNTNQNLA